MESTPVQKDKNRIIEALIFASDEPLTIKQIVEILRSSENGEPSIHIRDDEVLGIIRELNADYVRENRSFRIIQIAGGFQFATMPEFAEWLGKLMKERSKRKLSPAVLETLSVIAYKQPITKPELEAIRGVNADYAIQRLLERGLITIIGRAVTPGRPLLYGTTQEFLKHFGINDISELPKPREIEEIMSEQGLEMEREILKRMGKTEEEINEAMSNIVVSEDGHLQKIQPENNKSQEDNSDLSQSPEV